MRYGKSRRSRRGKSWYDMAGYVEAVEARSGLVRRVEAVMAWPGPVRRVVAVD